MVEKQAEKNSQLYQEEEEKRHSKGSKRRSSLIEALKKVGIYQVLILGSSYSDTYVFVCVEVECFCQA